MKLSRTELIGAFVVGLYLLFFAVNPPVPIRALLSHPVPLALVLGGAVYVTMYSSKAVGILLILAILLSMTSVTEHLTAGCTTPSPQQGFDRVGSDIETIDNIQSAQGCADRCCGNAGCGSYTYNGDNKKCFLKSGNPSVVASIANAFTGVVTRAAGSSTPSPQTTPAAALPMTTPSAPGTTVPPTLADGKIYKCTGTSEYGVVLNNKLSGFPNPEVAASYSSTWSADATEIECTSFNRNSGSAPMKAAASASTPSSSTAAPTLDTTPAAPVMACNLENFENFAPF
jgi:hypothetical protein